MAREDEFEYDSSSAPGTPRDSEGYDEKKKRKGLKRLISLTKKKSPNNMDKSPSESGRFESMLNKEGGSQSRRRGLKSFFKPSPRSKEEDDSITLRLRQESRNDEIKPGNNEKSQNFLEKPKELHDKDRIEALKKESQPSKLNPPAEAIGEKPKLPERAKEDNQHHPHKQTQEAIDDKGKSNEHQELEVVVNAVREKEVVENDQQHHHKQIEDPKGDAKDEQLMATLEEVRGKSGDLGSPPPPEVHDKEVIGCESLAKGLQKVCLPWTVNKEDH